MKKMLTGVSAALYAALCGGAFASGLPEAEFRDPSVANSPETWFHFIGGNVAKPGITADLEAIKGAGISGIHLFHGQFGGKWPGVEPQITCLSAPWDGLVFDAGRPQAKRRTWTIAGPKKGSALRDSGLIGPVRLIRCRIAAPVAGEAAMLNQAAGRMDAPVAGARVGFALTMAKRNGSTFTCVDTITHQRMASLSVATNGNVVTAVWRGHPKCGANFRVTARFTLLPGGGFEYYGFDWAGNESPFYVHRVSFPEVAVPRTERTAVFALPRHARRSAAAGYTKKRQAWMCGEAPKFQSMMRHLERTLVGTGLDGVYMDMIACAAHMPCFNPRHKHAPGGGKAVSGTLAAREWRLVNLVNRNKLKRGRKADDRAQNLAD